MRREKNHPIKQSNIVILRNYYYIEIILSNKKVNNFELCTHRYSIVENDSIHSDFSVTMKYENLCEIQF